MAIGNKSAMIAGKLTSPVSADFVKADKTIVAYKNAVTVGLIIHGPPRPEPVGETTLTTPLNPPAGTKSKSPAPEPKPKAKAFWQRQKQGSSPGRAGC